MSSRVHHCTFCGWSRAADAKTVLPPHCENCGSNLRAGVESDIEAMDTDRAGLLPPPSKSPDVTGVFGLFVLLPLLLPVVGVKIGAVGFAMPFIVLTYAAVRAAEAVPRARLRRPTWVLLTL